MHPHDLIRRWRFSSIVLVSVLVSTSPAGSAHAAASVDELAAALDAFSGEWNGEVRIHAIDGFLLKSLPARRTYRLEDEARIVETRFADGDATYESVARQFLQLGRLHATVTRPGMPVERFTGEIAEGGLVWTNAERNNRDHRERIVVRGDNRTLEASSFEVVRLKGLSGLVRLVYSFTPVASAAAASSPPVAAETARLRERLGALERELETARDAALDASNRVRAAEAGAAGLRLRIQTLETDAVRAATELRAAQQEREALVLRLTAATEHAATAPAEAAAAVDAARAEVAQALQRASRAEDVAETARTNLRELQADNERLRHALAEQTALAAAQTEDAVRAEALARTLEQTEARAAEAETALAASRETTEALRAELTATRAQDEEHDAALARAEARVAELTASANALAPLASERDALVARLTSTSDELEAIRAETTLRREEARAETERLRALEAELAETTASRAALETERDAQRTELAAADARAVQLADTNIRVEAAAERAREESARFQRENEALQRRTQIAEAAGAASVNRIRELETALQASEQTRRAAEEAKLAAERTAGAGEAGLADLRARLTTAETELAATRAAAAEAATAAQLEARTIAAQTETEVARLRAENEALRRGAVTNEAASAERIRELETELQAAEQTRREAEEAKLAAERTAGAGEAGLADLRARLTTAETELAAAMREAQVAAERTETEVARLRAENEALRRGAVTNEAASAERIRELETELQAAEQTRRAAEEAKLAAERTAGVGEAGLADLRARLTAAETELAATRAAAAEAQRTTRELEARIVVLQARPEPDSVGIERERRAAAERIQRLEGERLDALGRAAEFQRELAFLRAEASSRDGVLDLKQRLERAEKTAVETATRLETERDREAALARERASAAAALDEQLRAARVELDRASALAAQRQKDNEVLSARVAQLQREVGAGVSASAAQPAAVAVVSGPAATEFTARIDRLDRRVLELESERNAARESVSVLTAQVSEAKQLRDDTLARFQDVVSQLNAVREERDRLGRANSALQAELRAAMRAAGGVSSSGEASGSTDASGSQLGRFLASIIQANPAGGRDAMVAMVAGFEISGVQNAGPSSSVVLNGQTFRPGETVAPAQRLRLARIAASELVFTDAEGNEYRRSF